MQKSNSVVVNVVCRISDGAGKDWEVDDQVGWDNSAHDQFSANACGPCFRWKLPDLDIVKL